MSRAQVRTTRPNGTGQRYFGELGPVSNLVHSWTVPGGCDQMSCSLGIPPVRRSDAMDPGRKVEVVLGADVIWRGILDEPAPADGGWGITAHGSGTYGSEFLATYSGKWANSVPDAAVNNAVGRGLDWLASNIGHPTGIYLGQPQDSGSQAIDSMLNQLTSQGGLTWQVKCTPSGNELDIFTLPTTPNRLLVCADPAARTLGGDINAVCIRFQSTPDFNHNPAKHQVTFATDDASITAHGRMETYVDLSDAGPMEVADAQAIGNFVLKRYQRASFAGPFGVAPGQLLTIGGTPVDLGHFYTDDPMVCRLMLTDQGWGGEVTQQQVSFLVGAYEYDDDTGTATVTPFGTMRHDFASILAQRASHAHKHRVIRRRVGRDIYWRFAGQRKWHIAHNAANLPTTTHIKPPHIVHKRHVKF